MRDGRAWVRYLVLTLVVVALAGTFVSLGRWQLDRLEQRREGNEVVTTHERQAVRPYADVMTGPIADADQWQRVQVSGTFDPARQLVVRYRSNAGEQGWEVVTPLRADDGRTVLVDRGFGRRQPGQDIPSTAPAPPAGHVTVVGYVRRDEQGAGATQPAEGAVRLINSRDIGAWLGTEVVNGYISLLSVEPAQSAELRPLEPPPLDEGPHLSYAFQWFTFAAIAGVGLVILIRNDVRDRRRREARRGAVPD